MIQPSPLAAAQTLVLTQEAPPAVARAEPYSLLDAILDARQGGPAEPTRLDRFLSEPNALRAILDWVGPSVAPGPDLKGRLTRRLSRDVARLDEWLNAQVNAILHHPSFQRLEASWRGLDYLVDQVPEGENIRLRVLNISFDELKNDLLYTAIEFDQSQTFKQIYTAEFDMPGGEPFGAVLGDYEFTNHPEHLEMLEKMAGVAAASFAPFISAADPKLLDLKSFTELVERPLNLAGIFGQPPYIKWRALREQPDSRFVALTLPHILLRAPFRDDNSRVDGFRFKEEVGQRRDYLWGNASYAFGAVLVRTFALTGWLADIRGARRGEEAAGVVSGLPDCSFTTDRQGLVPRTPTDVIVTEALDRELSDLGFLPLCWLQDTDLAAFTSSQSIQSPKVYDRQMATVNASMSAMLQYMLCVSRFAHYIKRMGRDRIGSYAQASEFEDYLSRWLLQYTMSSQSPSAEMKARHPLRDARVEIVEVPGRPGAYDCRVFLQPQYQLDHLVGLIELKTRLSAGAVR